MATTVSKRKPAAPKRGKKTPGEDFLPMSFTIPADARDLAGFRRWSCSDAFPEHGQIFYLAGEIWVDMSPERLNSHNKLKTEMGRILANVVVEQDLGEFFTDRTRLVHRAADLSVEPDALFVSWESYESGLVKQIPTADEEDFIELEGSADWVVEILSPSSEKKDTQTLMHLYHLAKIKEYWLIDARGAKIRFMPYRWQETGFEPIEAKGGWYPSAVFGRAFRWQRKKNRIGQWTYLLESR